MLKIKSESKAHSLDQLSTASTERISTEGSSSGILGSFYNSLMVRPETEMTDTSLETSRSGIESEDDAEDSPLKSDAKRRLREAA